jgi:hypothetical protein
MSYEAFTHDDEITFGVHRGTKMRDVPAEYLLWLWNHGMWKNTRSNERDPMRMYIIKHFNTLETDCPDVAIDHRP